MSEAYYKALEECAWRYNGMISNLLNEGNREPWVSELYVFSDELMRNIEEKQPLEKLNRWLGYIQGVLISHGITTVWLERDWTRPKFRPLDYPT